MLWQAKTPALVLPEAMARSETFDIAASQSAARGWPVFTRRTGGGLTPQGPGVLNLAMVFERSAFNVETVHTCYDLICDVLTDGCKPFGVSPTPGAVKHSFCDGDHNLHVEGQKLVGTAQRWRGDFVLCHALILTSLDLNPAVTAIAAIGSDLGRPERYEREVHTSLATLMPAWDAHFEAIFAGTLEQTLMARGFQFAEPNKV